MRLNYTRTIESIPMPIVRRAVSLAALLLLACAPARAFWLLGFSPADTLAPGELGFISGTGGQLTSVGSPQKTSYTPSLPHAGIRLGLTDGFDMGYRLVQVALPFSSAGPTLASEVDVKWRMTDPSSTWQAALVPTLAYGYVMVGGVSKDAWSPGIDLVLSRRLAWRDSRVFTEIRYAYAAVGSAPGGSAQTHLHAAGNDWGLKIPLTPQISLIPEAGLFDFAGRNLGSRADGVGFQYGAVLSVTGLPRLWGARAKDSR